MKSKERMELITSNGPEFVRLSLGELVDLAPLGSVQITVFIMMLIAGIFQGYSNLAGILYAAPAVGNKTTNPQLAVRTATVLVK